jgi:hypothetical protein
MSSERARTSHATAWLLAVVAVPVLYVLTLPVIAVIYARMYPKTAPPEWLLIYSVPFDWLTNTPMRQPLKAYVDWIVAFMMEF